MTEPAVWSEVRPATVAGLLRFRAAERPERVAFAFLADGEVEAERLTYAELDRRARAIAARLRQILGPGERALLLYPPGLEFIAAFFGCLHAGVVAVPAYPPRARDRAQTRLRAIACDAEPKAALTTSAILGGLEARSDELAEMEWIATDTLPVEGGLDLPEPSPDAVAFLQYTSGSTATPKGVMVTHANLLHNERMIGEAFAQDEDSVVVGWLPLYHDMGLIGNVLQPVHAGATCVLMAPVAFLQRPARWLEAISRYRATTSGGPNFAYELCVRKVGPEERSRLDLSSWRVAFNGAEPVREATLARFAEAFGPCGFRREAFYPCYGLAEATLFVTGGAPGKAPRVLAVDPAALERHEVMAGRDEEARRLVSCGGPWEDQRVVVVEPETELECPPGRVGEIWIAGPSVARGYWRNAEATGRDFGAVLTGPPSPPETLDGPFLRTGDLGFVADGELYVTGRLKDLVIIRGRNHYPQDLELTAESSHPDLRAGSGAAFAVEVEGEERLVLVQEVERRLRGDVSEVAEAIRQAVAAEHEVQVWEVVLVRPGGVPKTSSGKVRRSACRAAYLDGELPVVGRSAVPSLPANLLAEGPFPLGGGGLGQGEGQDGGRLREGNLDGGHPHVGPPPAPTRPLPGGGSPLPWLRAAAARLLGMAPEAVALDRPLTGLGLDSLSAVELKGQAEAALGVELPLADLLQGASLGELAERLEAGAPLEEMPPLRPLPREGDQPVSFGQRSLWFLERLAPEAGAYNIAVAARIVSGELDVEALRRALARLFLRHEALRTVFPAPEGEPVQRVLAEIPSIVSTLSSPLEAEAWRPFDLERGPLLRVVIEGPVVLFVVHHLVADFWSLALAARELSALYLEESGGVAAALPALQLSYLDFTHWQEEALAGARGEALLEWWRERLAGLPDLDLPTDRPRPPIQTWRGAGQAAVLPPALADGVRVLASRHGATLFTALLAAFQAQLGRYTGQEDLAVGAPTAGRSAPELAGLVGYFVNPVVLRADLAGEPPFTDVLARARETVLTALARADLPFALLAERLRPVRDPARPPLFQAMLVLQAGRPQDDPGLAAFALGEAGARIGLGGLVLESLPLAERRAQFELILRLAEETSGGGLLVSLEHNADLFDTATAARMVEHFRTLLAGAVAGPDRCWADLPLLTEDERRQILGEWSGAGPRPEDTDATLSGLFEAWVARTPQAPALVFEGESVSYGDLDARAERLAGRLRRLGVGPEVVVGLCAERSIEMVVGILGVLKAGGAWLPLDPALPRERLAQLLADAEVPVLLAKAAVLPGLPPMEGESTRLLLLDSADEPEEIPASRTSSATADNLAYVLYTSGSTGAPKAVAVPHRGVANRLLRAREAYGIRPGDAMLQRAAGGFDVSVWEIFGPLSSGARVVLARPGGQRDPRYLARLLDEQEVTLVNFTPSALDALLDEEGIAERAASLRQVFVGAEALPRDLPVRFFAAGLRAPLDNMYGPTEASIDLLWYSCRPDARLPEGSTVPIGRPIPGTRVHVLDARLAPVPAGIPGELWLGGVGLARGYRGRPDLTAERFLPDPLPTKPGERLYRTGDLARWLPGGDLEFLGRVDLQVKVRGVRVEPGEVEAVLRGRPGVREAAVAPRADATGRQGLVAYVVWDAPSVLDARELRSFLAARLPEAMVPAAFLPVPELPRTPSGKLDRRALASAISGLFTTPPAGDGGLHTPPRTPVEELLAGLWSELLGAERIGVRDDFFELGGHSLLATRMLARVSRLFGVELPVSAAFQFPTLAALAEQIEAALGAASAPPLRAVARDRFPGGAPLSFAQRRLWFLDRLQPGSPVYNLPGAVRLTGPLDLAALASALSGVARRHESLRTVFRLEGDEPVQVIGSPSTVASAPPPLVDLAGLTEGLRNAEAEWLAGREAIRPFELAAGPLCRVSLLRLASGDHLLLVNLHHSVADGWSLGIFLRELAALYEGVPLPELPVQYADYAVWQREWMQGEALDSQLAYWRRQLADLPVVELPADRPRPAIRRLRGGVRSALLPAGLADAVEGIARGRGATLFMELLAAFQILLRRYTGEVSVPVGSPVANRQRPEVEGLIGFFANTLVLRASMADDPPFDTLLARVREACLEAYAHQDLPFERLVEELRPGRDLSQTPLFQVMLVLEEPLPRPRAGALELRPERIETETAKFDLTLTAAPVEDGRLVSALEYDSALFDPVTVDRMLGHWRTLLAGIVADPAAPVSALPLLQEAETDQVLRQWNATGAEERPDLCLHELFAEQARRTPTAEALVASDEEGDLRLTYQELSARAGRLAQRLRRLGVEPEVRVGVCLERSADLVVSLLAVLEAGGAYVPLDPAYPRERLEFMLADSSASVLLTGSGGPGADLGRGTGLVRLDPRSVASPDSDVALTAPARVSSRNLAYLIYTSGSTGRPKGVAVEHRSAVALVRWARQVFTPEELAGVLASTSVCFDLSVFELFVPLACGGKVILARNALELPALPAASEVTLVNTVPSAMAELARGGRLPASLRSLRTVNLAGEPLQRALIDRLYELPGISRVYNLYGPSEDTTYSTWELVGRDGGAPLIGRPVAGTRAYLLDARAPWAMAPVPAGVPGELLLAGEGLARGYLDQPGLTAERFVPDPFARLFGGEPGSRLYRTGDLARWRADGRLEFLGRIDHQVKVRGFRIELGEIEAVLALHPGLQDVAVTVRRDPEVGERLIAYVVPASVEAAVEPGAEPPASLAASLRSWLARTLPDYMIPAAWVTLPALPLTPNGKVDRRALPAPGTGEAAPRTPPRTPVEERLAAIWSEVLGGVPVGVFDSFFELGGHSLLATRVLARVAEAFGVELPLAALFQAPTVAALAESLAGLPATAQRLAAAPPEDGAPLSLAQQRLWFIDRLEPGAPAYNLWVAVRFGGDLRVGHLGRALTEVLRRHEPLRTVFAATDRGPEQVILPPSSPGELPWTLIELSGLPPARRQKARREALRVEALRPFDLAHGPVVRFLLVRLGDGEHVLMVTFHHIAADGWSLEVFFRELSALYAASAAGRPSPLPELPLRYADFAAAQRRSLTGGALAGHLAYWRQELAGLPVLELPLDRPRPPARSYRGASLPLDLPASLVDGLHRLAHAEGATLFMALLTGFATLLARTAGQGDFAVGVPTAGRERVETEGMVGLFINTLALRVRMADDPPFGEMVRQVRQTVLAGQTHEVPFEKLVEELRPERSGTISPLFQVLFAFLGAARRERVEMPGLTLELQEVETAAAKFDLTLSMHERDGRVHGWLDYPTDLFEASTATRWVGHLLTLLQGAAEYPDMSVGDLPMLSPEETGQILLRWQGPRVELPGAKLVHRLVTEQASRTPERVAVESEAGRWTYAELEERASSLASRLRALGIGPESRIGVCLDRSLELMAALLAIWKAGGAYVPLDPFYPHERLRLILDDARPSLLLTGPGAPPDLAPPGLSVLPLGSLAEAGSARSSERLPAGDANQLAYIIYTSGSTGQPKGVMISHGAIVNRLLWMKAEFPLDERDAVLQKTPLSFDPSLVELFVPLMSGARVVMARPGGHLDPAYMARAVAEHRISVLQLVPSVLSAFLEEDGIAGCQGLRHLLSGGEVLTPALRDRALDRVGAELCNFYGPTEYAVDMAFWRCRRGDPLAIVPIGRPIANTRAYVLDSRLRPVPAGTVGELYVAGAGLARGYVGRPDLTAERFVPDPLSGVPGGRLYRTGDLVRQLPPGRGADGALEYMGRADLQVKVRGVRIEPGEVESWLVRHPVVAEAVVGVRGELLVAWLVPRGTSSASSAELRSFLAERLPDAMVPSAFVILPELPRMGSGKVDRAALPAPTTETWQTGSGVPRTDIEELLSGLWAEVLGREQVGTDESFFDLGGHSLLATRLISRMRSALGVEISLGRLFEEPTVARLARWAEAALRQEDTAEAEPEPPLEPQPHAGPQPLSFAQERLWFLDRLDPGPAYNVPAAARLTGRLDPAALATALDEVVRRHEVLRTRFGQEGNRPVQVVEPWGPLRAARLPLVDLSLLPGRARDTEAARLAAGEAARPFDLGSGRLVRSTLLRLAAAEHVLLLTLHHIVADGWSMDVLLSDVSAFYGSAVTGDALLLPDLPIQYVDFALWQRRHMSGYRLETQLEHWRSRLAGAPEVFDLPADHPRPLGGGSRGGRLPLRLPAGLAAALTALGRHEGWTPFMGLLAAFQALLARYSSQLDVVVGSPIANRNRLETEGLIGFFVNTLALRLDLTGDPPFAELARRARAVALDAYAHQDLPFEKLVEELAPQRLPGLTPLFQTLLVLQNAPLRLAMPGLAVEPLEVDNGTAKFDLVLVLMEQAGELAGGAEYRRDLFEPATIARFVDHFAALLSSAVGDPGRRLGDLELLGEGERQQLMVEWSDAAWPAASALPTVLSLFEQRAEEAPEATALVVRGERLSYGELDRRAGRLARRLRRLGIGRSGRGRVGLLLARSAEMVESILAVWKAGAAYVPLAPELPAERLAWMAENAGIAAVVAWEQAPEWGVPALLLAEEVSAGESGKATSGMAEAGDLAYLIYTSGTTGRPKGVMVEHRSLSHTLLGMAWRFGFNAADRMPHLASFSFDISLFELFAPLIAGGTVELLTRDEVLDLPLLTACLRQATRWHAVPSLMRRVVDSLADTEGIAGGVGGLRTVFVGGDRVPPELLRDMRRVFPDSELVVLYGPTEAAIVCSAYAVPAVLPVSPSVGGGELERSLIGGPLPGVHLLVLDRWGSPVPIGVLGEIHIGGPGVSRGYHGWPGLTAARYVAAPDEPGRRLYRTGDLARHLPDGTLEFVGRVDQQVKIRGFRVEPGEIEAALRSCPEVAEAVVVAAPDRRGESRLAAYLVPARAEVLDERWARERMVGELREALSGRLPDYMIPVAWVVLPSLPLSPNGKVDHGQLPEPDDAEGTATHVPPRSPAEDLLAGIWCEVLGLERVGVQTSFFDLGGHSLLATQVMSRVREAFGVDLPLRRLFEAPTVAELARTVEAQLAGGGGAAETITRASRDQPLPLSFSQERLWVLDRLQSGDTAYNLPLTLRVDGQLDVPVLAAAFGEIIRRHETLRTTFTERDGEPVQVIHPAIPPDGVLHLPVVDLHGLAAYFREPEAGRLVASESARSFDLSRGPLLRTLLLRAGAGEHLLLVHMHHIVSDAWSMGVLVHEVEVLYNSFRAGRSSSLPELPVQYADFAVWQRGYLTGATLERQLGYWRERLTGAPGLDLPTDQPRPAVRSGHGAEHRFVVDAATSAALLALARRQGVTPFMLLAAALLTLLARFSGQPDLSIGSPIANRTRIETEELIGFFVNTLVLRAELGRSTDFLDLLRQVREITLGAYAHQDIPFEELVAALHPDRDLSHTPLFQVMFALQNATVRTVRLEGIEISPLEVPSGTAKFDLSIVLVQEGEGLAGTLEYATDLFDGTTAVRLARHFVRLLGVVVADPGAEPVAMELLSRAERHQILREWNDSGTAVAGDLLLHQLFELQADRAPEAPAAVWEGESLTYGELEAWSNRLANLLRRLGSGPEAPVAVWMERSLDMLAALLGTLKAGAAYLPIDAGWPAERVETVLAGAGARAILVRRGHLAPVQELQWRLPLLSDLVCLDIAMPEPPPEPLNPGVVRELWDVISDRAVDWVTAGGFVSSYTGQPFAEEEVLEYRDRVIRLADPWLRPDARVLEIGCGSGLILWELAPRTGRYVGLDPSPRTQERNRERAAAEGVDNVELPTGFAHEIDRFAPGSFDLVILASTAQFFPGPVYLERVLELALSRLAPGGAVVVADLLDPRRCEEFRLSLAAYAAEHPGSAAAAKAVARPGSDGRELYVDEDLFADLEAALPELGRATIHHRRQWLDNELRFRYDVVLEKSAAGGEVTRERRKRLWTGWHVERCPMVRPAASASPIDLAYVIHTSGSTGAPKGIMVQHRPAVELVGWVNRTFGVGPSDRLLFVTSPAFDLSVYDVFGVLAAGGLVHIASEEMLRDPERLARMLREEPITVWDSAPAALQQLAPLFPEPGSEELRLRLVLLSGDWIPVPLPDLVRASFPRARVISLGGATEATVWSNWYPIGQVDPRWPSIPYGRPIAGARYQVLDAGLEPCPIGVPGDLYIGGRGLCVGYARLPALTAGRFVPDPWSGEVAEPGARLYATGDRARYGRDGNLEFLGRVDQQVKVRGYRIELEEIEAVLTRHPGVREAVVVAREDLPGDPRLVGYVVASCRPAPAPAELRSALQQTLPEYMVPWTFVEVEALPLTANGKVDRKALPAPQVTAGEGYVAPRNNLERAIATVWREVLGLARVGVHDNFFELGGSSLLVVKLHGRLKQALGNRNLSVMDLFRYSTVDALARYLAAGEARGESSAEQARARTRTRRESLQQLSEARSQRRGRTE